MSSLLFIVVDVTVVMNFYGGRPAAGLIFICSILVQAEEEEGGFMLPLM